MAVGVSGLFYRKPLKYLASMHPEFLPVWKEQRRLQAPYHHIQETIQTHGFRQPMRGYGGDVMWENEFGINLNGAGSGCFAAAVGIKLGYRSIVLCGVPMDGTGNFYDCHTVNDDFSGKQKRFQAVNEKLFNGMVTSMSGWTREYLGSP